MYVSHFIEQEERWKKKEKEKEASVECRHDWHIQIDSHSPTFMQFFETATEFFEVFRAM